MLVWKHFVAICLKICFIETATDRWILIPDFILGIPTGIITVDFGFLLELSLTIPTLGQRNGPGKAYVSDPATGFWGSSAIVALVQTLFCVT